MVGLIICVIITEKIIKEQPELKPSIRYKLFILGLLILTTSTSNNDSTQFN